jgi:hypothetical protein
LKTICFQALFPCTYELALKWMGQNGALQTFCQLWEAPPPGGQQSHLRPVPHHILGDNDGRPRPPPVDASKLSKTYAFRSLSICANELPSKLKPPAGLGSKHCLVYSLSKQSKTYYFQALFLCAYESASDMDGPKWPASNILSPLGRSPPPRHDGHRGSLLHYILGGGDHPPRGTRHPPRGTRHPPRGTRDGLDVGRGTASMWDEGAPLAWDTLVLGRGTASTWDEGRPRRGPRGRPRPGTPSCWDTAGLGQPPGNQWATQSIKDF